MNTLLWRILIIALCYTATTSLHVIEASEHKAKSPAIKSAAAIKPVLPKAPRPTAAVAKIRARGRKAVIGKEVSQKEREAFAKLEAENAKDISDGMLEKKPFEDDEIEASPSLKQKILEKFGAAKEALSGVTGTLAENQNLVQTANQQLGQERTPLNFSFPFLGKGSFALEADQRGDKKIRLNIKFEKDGKEKLNIRPVVLDQARLEMIEGKLKGQLHKQDTVTVFGEEATFNLKKIELSESTNIINKVVLEVLFKKPIKKKLPFINEELTINSGYLTLQSWGEAPIILTAKSVFRGQKIRLMLLYSPQNRLTAALRVKKMPLVNLIPQVEKTPLGKMNISQATIYVDLWVQSNERYEGEIHIPENDPAREMRIEASLEKMEEIPIDDAIEEVGPELICTELSTDIEDEIAQDIKEDASKPVTSFPADTETTPSTTDTAITSTSLDKMAESLIPDIPAPEEPETEEPESPEYDYDESTFVDVPPSEEEAAEPDLVYPSDTEIDPDLIAEATPACDITETDTSLEEEQQEEAVQEGVPCDYINDPCCREKNAKGEIELQTSFSLEARLSRYNATIYVGANDIKIPHVGPVSAATLTLTLQRSGIEREDAQLRTNLKKKTLKSVSSSLMLDLSCVPIRDIGVLESGYINIELAPTQKERGGEEVYTMVQGRLELMGRMRLRFGPLGRLPIDVSATITRKGLIFTGKLDFCEKYAEEGIEQSETGYVEKEQKCLKNSLSYGGLTLENVKVMYGYPRYNIAETEEGGLRHTQQAMRQELKSMAADRRKAIRQVRDARRKGEKPDTDTLKLANSKAISKNVVRKPDERKQLSIIATTKIWGLRLITTLSLQPDPKSNKRKLGFSAKGVIKDFKPFKYIPGAKNIPGLKDITFGEISAELTINTVRGKARPSVKLGGAVTLFGALLRANCKFVVSKKGVPGVFIYTTPQAQQSLTDLMPVLQTDFFRNITCCNSSFVLSSVSEIDTAYFSPEEEMELNSFSIDTIRKGCAFAANVPFTGSLDKVGKWLGINKEPTAAEKERMAEEAKEEAELRALGKPVPPKQFCGGQANMFRMLANINFANPAFSEFRIGITRKKLRQFSQVSAYGQPKVLTDAEKALVKSAANKKKLTKEERAAVNKSQSRYQSQPTKFSDESLQPSVKSTDYGVASLKMRQEQEKQAADRAAKKAAAAAKAGAEAPPAQPVIELDQVEIFFLGDVTRPNVGVAVGFLVRPTPEELLRLKGSVEFSPKDVTIGAQMLGTWHNAFTLSGWDLGNVSFLLGFLYGTPFPVRLGGSAELKIKQDFAVMFKFVADADVSSMGFEGSINRVITWLDIINLFLKATKFSMPAAISNMPMPLEITNLYVRYAPKDLRIGEQIIERGFALKADISILKKKGKIDVHVDDSGLKGFGTIEKIEIDHVLQLTSADGTGDPRIDVEATLDRQNFLITGMIKIADIIEQSTFMEISSKGFKFDFLSAIGKTAWHGKPLLMAKVTADTSGTLSDPQFNLVIDLQQYFLKFIQEQATEGLQQAAKAVEKELKQAQNEIDKINNVIVTADTKIKEAEKQVNDARNALKTIQEARAKTKQTFEDAQRTVGKLRDEIGELDRWYALLPAV